MCDGHYLKAPPQPKLGSAELAVLALHTLIRYGRHSLHSASTSMRDAKQ